MRGQNPNHRPYAPSLDAFLPLANRSESEMLAMLCQETVYNKYSIKFDFCGRKFRAMGESHVFAKDGRATTRDCPYAPRVGTIPCGCSERPEIGSPARSIGHNPYRLRSITAV